MSNVKNSLISKDELIELKELNKLTNFGNIGKEDDINRYKILKKKLDFSREFKEQEQDKNTEEMMEYWGFSGVSGRLLFYIKYFNNWVRFFFAMKFPIPYFRVILQRQRGVKIGYGVHLGDDVLIDAIYPDKIYLGDSVDIGDRSRIYAHTRGNWPFRKMYPRNITKIKIGEGSWIANNVLILPGAKIGKYCVIGACSVINGEIPDYSFFLGDQRIKDTSMQQKLDGIYRDFFDNDESCK